MCGLVPYSKLRHAFGPVILLINGLNSKIKRAKVMQKALRKILTGLLFTTSCAGSSYSLAADNPDYFYFNHGDTPENWVWVLGDQDNWWKPIEANEGRSGTGKLTIKAVDYQGKGDAVNLRWNKKDTWAVASIAGRTIDLSKFEQQAELVIVAKLDRKAVGDIKLAMDCGEKCRGEIPIKDLLNQAKTNTWFVLPIALNCFSKAGVSNLSNVTAPFSIGTNSALSLSIASINIQKMSEGDQGCAPNPPASIPAAAQQAKPQ